MEFLPSLFSFMCPVEVYSACSGMVLIYSHHQIQIGLSVTYRLVKSFEFDAVQFCIYSPVGELLPMCMFIKILLCLSDSKNKKRKADIAVCLQVGHQGRFRFSFLLELWLTWRNPAELWEFCFLSSPAHLTFNTIQPVLLREKTGERW